MTTPEDFLDLASTLTPEEEVVRATVARFVDERVLPIVPAAFEAGRFPRELVPEIGALGLLGTSLEGYGCPGLGPVAYGLVCEEFERADSGLRSFVSVQSSLVMYPIHAYGSEEQKQEWLPRLARAEAIGCFGLTEPHGGSDPGAMRTRARRAGGDWILDGSKMWITNGSIADVAVVWAQAEEGILGFLVERGTPGFTASDIEHKASLRASVTSALYFDGVRVPESRRLPVARGLKGPLSCLTQARYGIAWGACGAARSCLATALAYTRERTLFGAALAEKQIVQQRLARMVRGLATAQLLAHRLGALKRAGTLTPAQVSLAKWNNVRVALDIARDARDLLGGAGITLDFPPIRHALNLESVITYEGTETIHELAVGREITGVGAF
jgi:glutaryl-CoA dehydrogenase